jgi:pimeloyl-ACP methyl ester carboxylesterase
MPYARTPNGELYYEVIDHVAPWETGRETLVFHHGIGASAGIWQDWLPALIDRYRIVTFEMRGYGRSNRPPREYIWSLDKLAQDVIAVADAAGVERMHLVGESIGGTIALYCAIHHGERLASLTISNGADVGAPLQKVEAWQKQIDEQGIKAWSDQFMRDRFYEGALDEKRYAWYAKQQEAWTRDSILNALAVLVGTDLRPKLADVSCPVLLLHGDTSPFIPVSVMVEMHQRFANSRLQVFPRARHGLPFSHARECSETLRQFLETA